MDQEISPEWKYWWIDRVQSPDVYFIQCGDDGPIKIATAQNVRARLTGVQVGNHHILTVRGIIPNGGVDMEMELHSKFSAFHIRGDWFYPTLEVLEAVKSSSEYVFQTKRAAKQMEKKRRKLFSRLPETTLLELVQEFGGNFSFEYLGHRISVTTCRHDHNDAVISSA